VLLILSPRGAEAAALEGRVFSEEGFLQGARVYVYRTLEDALREEAVLASSETDEKGLYILRLPEGRYYMVARGPGCVAFHGANPIEVGKEGLWLPFLCLPSEPPLYMPGRGVEGVVLYRGKPLAGAHVSAYFASGASLRGIGVQTVLTDEQGAFRMELLEGSYVLLARKRHGAHGPGPLQEGDFFCYYGGNPVQVKEGQALQVRLECYRKGRIEESITAEKRQRKRRYREVNAKRAKFSKEEAQRGDWIITGRVEDTAGKPLAGLYVLAYKNSAYPKFRMYLLMNPQYVTETDAEGRYRLSIKEEGMYYLVVRQKLGADPQQGEYFGIYEENPYHSIEVREGKRELSDVNITAERVFHEVP